MVEVGRQILSGIVPQNAIHQSLQGGWRVVQPKPHHIEDEQTVVRQKYSFRCPRVLDCDHNPSTDTTPKSKKRCAEKISCEDLIDSRYWVAIFDCHLVALPVVHTDPKSAIFLCEAYYRRGVRAFSWVRHGNTAKTLQSVELSR